MKTIREIITTGIVQYFKLSSWDQKLITNCIASLDLTNQSNRNLRDSLLAVVRLANNSRASEKEWLAAYHDISTHASLSPYIPNFNQFPDAWKCPITQSPMHRPVQAITNIMVDGRSTSYQHSFELSALVGWFRSAPGNTNPVSRAPVREIKFDTTLMKQIQDWHIANGLKAVWLAEEKDHKKVSDCADECRKINEIGIKTSRHNTERAPSSSVTPASQYRPLFDSSRAFDSYYRSRGPSIKLVLSGGASTSNTGSVSQKHLIRDQIFAEDNNADDHSAAVDFRPKTIIADDHERITFRIWDSADQERFACTTPVYYLNTQLIVLCPENEAELSSMIPNVMRAKPEETIVMIAVRRENPMAGNAHGLIIMEPNETGTDFLRKVHRTYQEHLDSQVRVPAVHEASDDQRPRFRCVLQ